ncbi:hypothetical protein SAMN05518847_1011174 [Paenibacillus sp. OV219]|nr:hypothetical protein SAMN05518847_1011174 [Paenibacillus sp. OV219]
MDISNILKLVQAGDLSPEDAELRLKNIIPAETDLGFAQLDLHRELRTGFPEVIFGEGKTAEQIILIMQKMMAHNDRVLATRIDSTKAVAIIEAIGGSVYHPIPRAVTWFHNPPEVKQNGYIAVVCAGTSDLPVAEEAALTAEYMGSKVERVYDVGVAGIHRLFKKLPLIRGANAIVVAAGMEGALTSVIGGLVASPVIAVPTSIGYGANLQGLAALLTMLNSCAPGVSVVNIDNGFGAGYMAGLINQNISKRLG